MVAAGSGGRTGESGIALLLVIWVLALLAGVAAQVTVNVRSSLDLTRDLAETSRTRALAESGIWVAVGRLRHADAASTVRLDGVDQRFAELGDAVVVSVRDERAKLDLNAIGETPLRELLQAVGADRGTASRLARDVVHRRSVAAAAARREAHSGTRGFTSIAQLRRIDGVTTEVWRRLSPFLTVYTGDWGINAMTAPWEVLAALPGVDAVEARGYVELRRRYAADAVGLRLVTPLAIARQAVWTVPSVVHVTAKAQSEAGGTFVREAIVDLRPDDGGAFQVLSWSQAASEPSHPDRATSLSD